ncbi:DUF1836 domain-containing protein [Liquorilactobacillus mali]|uniref:BS ykrK family protein n=1 Tax=Liquorilactobacillus mali KCTC 3596 = DSM 20444 TaxID=1046596 RepID=J0L198_9LACO|nr:DUF1836 domain-containing protein [Liquorilactobacillus mali]EJF01460.1 hypothetical protein LMA_01389 [Liquorilactobacillus mali KCTC 3596 = DSM 20444]KRN10081.1 hypothetical protein FD00_GL000463 [Liquorilactobacillus mali KCTC 3596 = DSM 20444]MDC7953874.1 DUF1836 domain-containing protein [Liquorilactobacillus mali]MDV7758025.1 DUF1836 domain-containing protein [Liquorilactobacillus mali]QFQ75218.1 DUF1836 domain-containing protein [Liquorilactobacillus mali]
MHNEFEKWLTDFSKERLPLWNEFPDFDLYMDQLVNLGNRYLENLIDTKITASMINSYVKKGLMERPSKKKYTTTNVAELVVISLLKSIFPLETIRSGIKQSIKDVSVTDSYDYFANLFNRALSRVSLTNSPQVNSLPLNENMIQLTEQFAVHAIIYKMIGEKLVNLQRISKNK